jgi:hypothetical protein
MSSELEFTKHCLECGRQFRAKRPYYSWCPKCYATKIRPGRESQGQLLVVVFIILIILAIASAIDRGDFSFFN